MATKRSRTPAESTAGAPRAAQRPPRHRRGGQELPDNVQDRPEQNAGYDDAVHFGPSGTTQSDLGIDIVPDEGRADVTVIDPAAEDDQVVLDIDESAERSTIADVRRRERRGR